MRKSMLVGVSMVLLAAACATAGDALKSGPQVGKSLPGPFHPLNCTGARADEKNCLV
ncbi:MAG TPA: hypothetical protein VFE62_15915 [Gemmataceae bacterium]|nr:hypothetical protein [Gemmataceae bacterium]